MFLIGNGSPEGVVGASIGAFYRDRTTDHTWLKAVAGLGSMRGWKLLTPTPGL